MPPASKALSSFPSVCFLFRALVHCLGVAVLSQSGRRRCSYLALSPEGFTILRDFPFIPSFLRFFFFLNHEWEKIKKEKQKS